MKCLNCEISVSGWRLGGMEVGLKLTRMEQTFYLPRYCAAATRCSAILKKKQDYKGNKKLCYDSHNAEEVVYSGRYLSCFQLAKIPR